MESIYQWEEAFSWRLCFIYTVRVYFIPFILLMFVGYQSYISICWYSESIFIILAQLMYASNSQVYYISWFWLLLGRDEKQQLLLGIRRANRQPTNLSSSVLSSDSMHIGILAAAAHASANNSPFTVFYNPRSTSVTDFILLVLMHNLFDCNGMWTCILNSKVFKLTSFLYVQGQSLRICYSIGQVLQGSIQPPNITWHAL